jgi:hypothetical protein
LLKARAIAIERMRSECATQSNDVQRGVPATLNFITNRRIFMSNQHPRIARWAVLLGICLVLAGAQNAYAQDPNDLNTKLPPPPLLSPTAATSQTDVDNGDGTWTFTQTINRASTAPHYTPPTNGGGFDIYSWFNQDYGWRHDFSHWSDPNLQVIEASLTVVAWDIDSEPTWGYDGEYDGVHVDGTLLNPGYLQGNNNAWSTTVFALQRSAIVDDGLINVWLNIDMHHTTMTWATTLDHCTLRIVYSVGDPNNQPYEPNLAIYPECPGDNDDLTVAVTGPDPADPNGDDVHYEYRWFVDVGTGQYIDDEFAGRSNHTGNIVPAADTVVGDLWRVQVLPVDSTNQRGDYTTATWPEAVGCNANALEILDGNPRYLNGLELGVPSPSLDQIATGGQTRGQVAADGNSLLLIRLSVAGPGMAALDIDADGGLTGSVTDLYGSATNTVRAVLTSHGYKAFWIYTPPESFFSGISLITPIASRSLSVEATFEPDSGLQSVIKRASLMLRHPPTMLVHGIWSSTKDCWGSFAGWKSTAAEWGFPLTFVDYHATTERAFDFNFPAITRTYELTLDYYRSQGLACSQVNVVAHSMGGDLTRRWAKEPTFSSAGNFHHGCVNALVTIDTPHQGSPLAASYKSLQSAMVLEALLAVIDPDQNRPAPATACCVLLAIAGKLYGEGVEDLIPGSPALVGLGETPIPSHAIYGAGGTNSFSNASGSEWWFSLLPCPQYINTAMFNSEEHDYIVTTSSQMGGMSAPFVTRQDGVAGEHTSATKQATTVQRVFDLLRSGAEDSDFSSSIPGNMCPAALAAAASGRPVEAFPVIALNAPTKSIAACASVISPANGAVVRPGHDLEIMVDVAGSAVSYGYFVWDGNSVAELDPDTGVGALRVVDADCGHRTGSALLVLEDGSICKSAAVVFDVVPEASVAALDVLNSTMLMAGPHATDALVVGATYTDGVFRPAASHAAGTTYEVADPAIADVDQNGQVRALRPGSTEITIRNGATMAQAEVHVLYAVANADPIVTLAESFETCLGDTLVLSAAGTYDPDARAGESLAYAWDLDGDGTYSDALGEEPRVTVLTPGEWDIGLEVRDISGGIVYVTAHLRATFCGAIIDGALPNPPVSGSPIQIIGRLFGPDPGEGNRSTDTHNISFGGARVADANLLSWDGASIRVLLPAGIYSGDLIVTVEGLPSNEFNLVFPNVARDCIWFDSDQITQHATSRGTAWGDYDNDGDPDLLIANYGLNHLYRNDNGVLVLVPDWCSDADPSFGAVWGDYDNDHDLDLFVVNDGVANALYRNDGGTFTRVDAGDAADPTGRGYNAAWADYDNDRDLDLYVCNVYGTNHLYRNDNGHFVNVGGATEVSGTSRGCAFGDYDNDGDQDLYVSRTGENRLFRNDEGVFVDVTASPVNDAGEGKGVAWGDYDNDGDLDLYLVNNGTSNKLFRNDHPGFFTDATDPLTGDKSFGRACAWIDYDNNGWLDLFLANASGGNHLFHNTGTAFVDSTCGALADTADLSSWGCGFADYDRDGDQDLAIAVGAYNGTSKLIRNDLYGSELQNWLQVDLRGVISNSFGVGARIVVDTGELTLVREVSASGAYLSQAPLTASFGLAGATQADVTVLWPSGTVQKVFAVPVNQRLALVEQAGTTPVENLPVPSLLTVTNHPNPFNPSTTLEFSLPRNAQVDLRVLDVSGRLVSQLLTGEALSAGWHSAPWRGRDDAGKLVPSGVYFYRLQAAGETVTGRMLLLK